MQYKTLDDAIFSASSPTDLVNQLRYVSWTPSSDINDFMQQMSKSCKLWNRAIIRTTDPDTFVADLIDSGFLTLIE